MIKTNGLRHEAPAFKRTAKAEKISSALSQVDRRFFCSLLLMNIASIVMRKPTLGVGHRQGKAESRLPDPTHIN